MKQKTKKLLQLSFSLGFLATTALVATSCNQPKTITTKPTNPTPMQPEVGSTPGSGTTMQPDSGSGSGSSSTESGITTSDNTELKAQLKALIDKENTNVAMYDDYSEIKSTLTQAYQIAKTTNSNANATKDQLTVAKTTLQAAIDKAADDKKTFDNANAGLVNAYTVLKTNFKSIDLSMALASVGDDAIYSAIKTDLNQKYNAAKAIIDSGVQKQDLSEETINSAKYGLTDLVSSIESKKDNVDSYSTFKIFKISDGKFEGDALYTKHETSKSIIGFSSSFENSSNWQYATRHIEGIDNEMNNLKLTNVGWIYDLNTDSHTTSETKKSLSYDISFEYYGGSTATLYFPYKAAKSGQSKDNLSLKYKLNNKTEMSFDLTNIKVDGIEVAKIQLSDLNFGQNKISFSTENGKKAPMIGNMYIATTDTTLDAVYNNIFGNKVDSSNHNSITVDLVKGYGLANRDTTKFKKVTATVENENFSKDYYLIENLGGKYQGAQNENKESIQFYTFYVNAPKNGNYDISGMYISNQNKEIYFWRDKYGNKLEANMGVNGAKFNRLNSTAHNKIKSFNATDNNISNLPTYLPLNKGLNKIVVSGGTPQTNAPNLLNVTFTLQQRTI
ncbi:Vmc-like lipoprotein signal peptide domain-containing protein [Mycoplasma bradburyae]|uniref:Vmc-like lipoprotein signal peptide domain-containing protein n=1 Tax=Mycoplasma bradburyae TaxID=2963128 RepID=UPI002341CD66|nr:hypothetical protein [Mycoplasma bradburyae]MDC4182794.1 hypothetical protein [Mycoplasma bradburyae]